MATRLTTDTRHKITNAVVNKAMEADLQALNAEEAEIFDAVYEERYTKEEREELEKLAKRGWVNRASVFTVRAGGVHVQIQHKDVHANGDQNGHYFNRRPVRRGAEQIGVAIPASFERNCYDMYLVESRELIDKITDFHNMQSTYNEKVHTLSAKTLATLQQFYSVEKLVAAWPEIEQFAAPYCEAAKAKLPAIQILDLNRALGLPIRD